YSFEDKHEIKELFHFEYNNGIPSFVFSNCNIFGYKYNIAIIKIQIAINQLKMFVDTDIEAVHQKMLNRSITSNYLTDEEEELIKVTSKQIVSSSLDILEDDNPNEREYKIQYLYELKERKKGKFNISDWKATNYNLLAKNEQLYFYTLEKQ
ncbi:15379_t:CDS:2, partial [Dentiscutata heterogama]